MFYLVILVARFKAVFSHFGVARGKLFRRAPKAR